MEYEVTISQLRVVTLENEAKNTIIKKKEEQIEQLETQVEELTPFRAFVLGIIELFADKRIEPATRLDMVELSIKRSFPSLFQKAKEKLQQTVKRLPTFTPPHKGKNDDKSKNYQVMPYFHAIIQSQSPRVFPGDFINICLFPLKPVWDETLSCEKGAAFRAVLKKLR